MEHAITETCLERFATGRTTSAENRSLVAHLLKGCAFCSRTLRIFMANEISPSSYDPMLSRLERSVTDDWSDWSDLRVAGG